MKKTELPYSIFAGYYDTITAPFQKAENRRLHRFAREHGCRSLCDYACGTGTLLKFFQDKKFSVSGCDISRDMIEIAAERTGISDPSRLCVEDMVRFNPGSWVDMASCRFDAINYLKKATQWRLFFSNVFNALNPGGIFLFDFVTEHDLIQNWPGHFQVHSGENWVCTRLAAYDPGKNIGSETMHWFIYDRDQWIDRTETHCLVSFPHREVREMLKEAGFTAVRMTDYDTGKRVSINRTVRTEVYARKKRGKV